MTRVLVTGAADGLGHVTARQLVEQGHAVTLHARSQERAAEARARVPGADGAVVGDLGSLAAVRDVAAQADASGATTPSSTTRASATSGGSAGSPPTGCRRPSPSTCWPRTCSAP